MASKGREILPATVQPINYAISIFDIKYVGSWSFRGTVKIHLIIKAETDEIVLNTRELKLENAEILLEREQASEKASNISYNETCQCVFLKFSSLLPAGRKAWLSIKFQGGITSDMSGFYRSKYTPAYPPLSSVPRESHFAYHLSTHFEPCDARRAFPCFDEPNLKATFDFEVEVPQDQVVISNMPEKESKGLENGLKLVSFDRTPVMSTYLLCWAVGDFEYVEGVAKRAHSEDAIPVRIFATRGLREQCHLGLKETIQNLEYFNKIFDVDFPLPKLDCVAVHEFCNVAMENWGLMLFSTTTLLYDARSDVRFQNRLAYIIAHELAHQWFGDLVTMNWWNDIWLNEGFATWAGWLAVDHFHPDWNIWRQFSITALQKAFELDSLRNSHPIVVEVQDALEIMQAFDDISYLKGASILRMLSDYLGVDTFLFGVSAYLKAHAYGNASTQDLWAALSEISGKDIAKFMNNWTTNMGFPVIDVTSKADKTKVCQRRFLLTGEVVEVEDETIWPVPLQIKSASGDAPVLLMDKDMAFHPSFSPYSVSNPRRTGFYLIKYPADDLVRLVAEKKFSASEVTGIVGDTAALALAGQCSTTTFLDLLQGIEFGNDFWLWSQALQSLSKIQSIFAEDREVAAGLTRFTLDLIGYAVRNVGWSSGAKDDVPTVQLQALLLATAGVSADPNVIMEAQNRFNLFTSGADKSAIDPSLRVAIFSTVLSHGAEREYEAVKFEYLHSPAVDGKDIGLMSLGCVRKPEIIISYLDFIFAGNVSLQDIRVCATALSENPSARRLLWKYIKDNWEPLHARMGSNSSVLERFMKLSLKNFADFETEAEIRGFFQDKDTSGFDMSLAVVLETIKVNAQYRERDGEVIMEWLAAKGFV